MRLSSRYGARMGKRGPKPLREDGCYVTPKGYLRGNYAGRLRLQHVVMWERANGPVPAGWQVHHVNGDKQDNRLENLRLVTATEHKRVHGGCELRDGVWFKPCRVCGQCKAIDRDNFYLSREGWPLYGRCRSCHIRDVVERKKVRRLRSADSK